MRRIARRQPGAIWKRRGVAQPGRQVSSLPVFDGPAALLRVPNCGRDRRCAILQEERARTIRRLDERAAERAALIRLERERDGFFDSSGSSMMSTPLSSSSHSSCEGPMDPTTGWRPRDFIDTIWRVAYVECNNGVSWWTLRADNGPAHGMEAEVRVIGLIGDGWRPQWP